MEKDIFINIIKILKIEFLPQDLVYLALNKNLPNKVKKIFEKNILQIHMKHWNFMVINFYLLL